MRTIAGIAFRLGFKSLSDWLMLRAIKPYKHLWSDGSDEKFKASALEAK